MNNHISTIKDSGERREFSTGSVRDRSLGKGQYDLLPMFATEALARHFEAGGLKYDFRNWEKGQPICSYLNSAIRHIVKHLRGQRDEPHLIAAAWNVMCAIDTLIRIDLKMLPENLDDLPPVLTHEQCEQLNRWEAEQARMMKGIVAAKQQKVLSATKQKESYDSDLTRMMYGGTPPP